MSRACGSGAKGLTSAADSVAECSFCDDSHSYILKLERKKCRRNGLHLNEGALSLSLIKP